MENYINKKLGDIHIHQLIQQIHLNDLLMDFDATSIHPSAFWDEKSFVFEFLT